MIPIDDKMIIHHTQLDGKIGIQFLRGFHHKTAISVIEQIEVGIHVETQIVAETHFGQSLGNTAVLQRESRNNSAVERMFMDKIENTFRTLHIGQAVFNHILDKVDMIAFFLEFGRNDMPGVLGGDVERDKCRRHIEILEGAAHGVLATQGSQTELFEHPDAAEHGGAGFAPAVRVVAHLLEILLEGESEITIVGAGSHHLGHGL